MLFMSWIVANGLLFWGWEKWTDKSIKEGTADPVGQSFAGLIALAVLNAAFLGFWIF